MLLYIYSCSQPDDSSSPTETCQSPSRETSAGCLVCSDMGVSHADLESSTYGGFLVLAGGQKVPHCEQRGRRVVIRGEETDASAGSEDWGFQSESIERYRL